jgi:hypothetical protein
MIFQLHASQSDKLDGKMITNSERIRILKETVVAYMKVH